MPDWLHISLDFLAWTAVIGLIVGGLIGTFLPVLPGTFMIFLGAVTHRIFLGPEHSIEWAGFLVLGLLVVISFIVDFASSALGAKWFGASKWGAGGAIAGAIVGIFFGILGLIIGPIIGAFLFEMIFAKKNLKEGSKSGAGTVVGATAGLAGKVAIAVLMIVWIIVDMLWIHI